MKLRKEKPQAIAPAVWLGAWVSKGKRGFDDPAEAHAASAEALREYSDWRYADRGIR
jgi:hypothetical protein